MKRLIPLIMMLVLVSCGPDEHHGRVEGRIDGINDATILAFVNDSAYDVSGSIDSVTVKRGKFSYEREITHPVMLTLLYPNFSTTRLILAPGKTAKVSGDASRLSELKIDGNDDNLLLTEFRLHRVGKPERDVQREAATFIRSHAKTQAALVLFREYFADAAVIEHNPTASLLSEIEKSQPKNPVVKDLASHLCPILTTAPGQSLPAFTGRDLDGKSVSSADYKNRPLFIVFCAQWDGTFYNIKHRANKLKSILDNDRMAFLFVSLDVDKENLRRAINYDPLPGKILYDGKGFDSPLVRKLGMRYISGSLLVGRDGKIKARDIPVDQWEEKIPTLL